MFELRRSKIGDIPYEAGGTRFLDLPKDFAYLALNCRLTGRLTISGGATSGTPWTENPQSLIERLRIFGTKTGGAVEIINLDGGTLYEISHILKRSYLERTAISSGAAAAYDFIADIEIPLHVPNVDEDAILRSLMPGWAFDNLQMEIKWRDGALTTTGGLISGGDRTLALTAYGSAGGSPSISVIGIQPTNVDPSVHNPVLFKMYKKTLVTESVESARKEPLNKGNFYRSLLYKAYADTAERATANDLVNNIKLLISGNSKEDWPFMQLRAENKAELGIETVSNGYAVLDFCRDGDPQTMLDTSTFVILGTSLETELNLSGAASKRVDIVTMEVVPAGAW